MDDLISRKRAIDLFSLWDDTDLIKTEYVRYALKILPSAQKTGKWIPNSPVTMKCDQCGYVIKDWKWNETHFCANCGADMREKKKTLNEIRIEHGLQPINTRGEQE